MVTQRCAGNCRPCGRSRCRFRLHPVWASHSLQGEMALPDGPPDRPLLQPLAICPHSEGNGMLVLGPGSRNRRVETTYRGWMKRPAVCPLRHQGNGARERLPGGPRPRARAQGSQSAVARPFPSRPTNSHFLSHSQPTPTLHEE